VFRLALGISDAAAKQSEEQGKEGTIYRAPTTTWRL
jgi:hypothetical protein